MFEYEARGDELVIDKVSDDDGWSQVKETLIKSVGTGVDPGYQGRRRRLRAQSHALPQALS